MLSFIIPTLNEEKYLPKLLQSLVRQTVKDFEVIVCDATSEDKTVAEAKKFKRKLRSLVIIENLAPVLPAQRNTGAANAHGDWYVFVDADAVLSPSFCERLTEYIRTHKPAHLTTWFEPDSEVAGDALIILLANVALELAIIAGRPAAMGQLSIIRKDAFRKVHGYDEALKWGEDSDISRRLNKAGYPLRVLRETLCMYSLRRFRSHGTLRTLQIYAKGALILLLTKHGPKEVPGYIMGGHVYKTTKSQVTPSMLRRLESQLLRLMNEFF
jgi:glycosyltransferase involved in cell wall biosynthesis